jgi:hypothetical protein
MNPTVAITVVGDMTTTWRRFAAVTIVQPVEVATHLRTLTDQRLLPTRCRLFRRSRVLVARDHIEVRLDNDLDSVLCPEVKGCKIMLLLEIEISGSPVM